MHTDSKNDFQIDLFGNAPILDSWLKKIQFKNKIFVLFCFTWLPLILISFFEGKAQIASRHESILWDFAIHMRFLLALPLLAMACMKSGKHFKLLFHQFIDARLLNPMDHDSFHGEITKTIKLRDSRTAKAIILGSIYMILISGLYIFKVDQSIDWRTNENQLSFAGLWYYFIAWPLYLYLLFFFLYRTLLWCRLLFKISRMHLQIKVAHGDNAGGLGFLGHSLELFVVPAFAISLSFSGGMLNLVLHENLSLTEIKFIFALICGTLLLFFPGPLLFFFPVLREAKLKGIMRYGKLIGNQLETFEKKWTEEEVPQGKIILEGEDFQNIDSGTSIMQRIHEMKLVPLSLKNLLPIVVAILLPFLPVVALKVPWKVILQQLTKILM